MNPCDQCSECALQYAINCAFKKLPRKVQTFLSREGGYNCKSFKQKPPPPPRMTDEEFNKEQEEILTLVPNEFRSVLSHMAWEDGHSAGYEEVISILKGLVNDLKGPINAFGQSVLKGETILISQ